jgi:hypothetical protein
MIPAVKRKGFEVVILKEVRDGSASLIVSEVQVINSLLTVFIAMLVNSTAKMARMVTEQNPPEAVENSDSYLYLMN